MLTRREALRGGTASVAAIAAAGAVAAAAVPAVVKANKGSLLPASVDPEIEKAAQIYWAAEADYRAVIGKPDNTDEEADAAYYPKMDAYDDLMALSAAGVTGLAAKVKAYRNEFFECVSDYMDTDDLDGLLTDIEHLAGGVS